MEGQQILIPYYWRRAFGVARLALAVSSAAAVARLWPALDWQSLLPAGLYLAFSLAVVLGFGAGRVGLAALPLVADLFFFLFLASEVAVLGAWLPSIAYTLTLLNAAVLRGWREVALAFGCGTLYLAVAPDYPDALAGCVLSSGSIALAASLFTALLKSRLDSTARLSVHYRAHAENARDAERQRIAADFHDGPLQSFISFQMHLEILRKLLERDPHAAVDELAQLQALCRGQVAELRSFVRAMRQRENGSAGLAASIHRLVEAFEKDSGIPAEFSGADFAGPEDPEVPLEVLQIVREALHNVQKHSKASRVSVSVAKNQGGIEISIEDDGCGFPFAGSFNLKELDLLRLGPVSIKRRVGELGGDLTVESHPGHGSGLKIRVPA